MSIKKAIQKFLMVYLILVCLFTGLLTLVYCIPEAAMSKNIQASVDLLQSEGLYPTSYTYKLRYDNWTVAMMMNEAAHASNGNPLVAAMANSFSGSGDSPINSLVNYLSDKSGSEASYSRYWNGYLVALKPALLAFDLQQIRSLLNVLYACLFSVCVIVLVKKFKHVGIGLSISLAFSVSLCGCFEYASVMPFFPSFALALIGIIWVAYTRLDTTNLAIGFFVLGSLTVYFDFLDNPIMTLGFPLTLLVYRQYIERSFSFKNLLVICITSSAFWFIGYALLWITKWILGSIVTGNNVVFDAVQQANFRLGNDDGGVVSTSPFGALIANLGVLGIWKVILVILCTSVVACIVAYKRDKNMLYKLIPVVLMLFGIAIIPVLWTLVLSNHSTIHAWFTWRNFSVSLFALSAALATLLCVVFKKRLSYESV